MKKLLLLMLVASAWEIRAQITINNSILPSVGDVYNYAVDTVSSGITVTASGGNQSWDFSKLARHRTTSVKFVDPASVQGSASFPGANLASAGQGQNSFYRTTTKNLELLGVYNGGNPLFGGANVFDKPAVILRTPMDYQDNYDYTTNTQFAISGAFVPDSLTMGLKVDSIRVKVRQDVSVLVDAWGQVTLATGQYQTLRQKRTTSTALSVEAKVPILGWFDVTQIASGFIGRFLGSGVSVQYVFLSNTSKGEIAAISTDTTGAVTQVSFKDGLIGTRDIEGEAGAIRLMTPIVLDQLSLSNISVPDGIYRVEQWSADGRFLTSSDVFLQKGTESSVPATGVQSGYNIVLVRDRNGAIHWSGRYVRL
ncbi:MAG: hypothetical protein U0V49_10940 [Saprospiraceae bacterium]